jgi:hypothetical protein
LTPKLKRMKSRKSLSMMKTVGNINWWVPMCILGLLMEAITGLTLTLRDITPKGITTNNGSKTPAKSHGWSLMTLEYSTGTSIS